MTTELVLLLGLFAFILLGAFFGESGPEKVFLRSAPRLAAHLESQLETGNGFSDGDGNVLAWSPDKP
jgi:hypothetical protein